MRRISRIFFALFLFFIIVSAGALFMLDGSGSVFNRGKSGSFFIKREKAVLADTVVGEKPDGEAPLPGPVETPEPQEEPEPEEEILPEEETLPDTAVTEEEETAEEEEPEIPEEDKVYPIRFYTFVSVNKDTALNLRTEPDMEAKVKAKLGRGTKGWVLKPGNVWCYVKTTAGSVGWCSTEFLEFSEHSRKAFTNWYAQQVEPPTEELSSVFEDVWASDREKEQRAEEIAAEEEAAAQEEAAAAENGEDSPAPEEDDAA